MKLIICGGRDYVFDSKDEAWLDMLRLTRGVSMVIEGGQTGADFCAKMWAKSRGIFWHEEPAKWDDLTAPGAVIRKRPNGTLYNAKAGPDRNRKMASMGDACAVFPGGRGTRDMETAAREKTLEILVAPMRL